MLTMPGSVSGSKEGQILFVQESSRAGVIRPPPCTSRGAGGGSPLPISWPYHTWFGEIRQLPLDKVDGAWYYIVSRYIGGR